MNFAEVSRSIRDTITYAGAERELRAVVAEALREAAPMYCELCRSPDQPAATRRDDGDWEHRCVGMNYLCQGLLLRQRAEEIERGQ